MDINISNLPVCYFLQGFFLSFSLEMGKISAYCLFNGYQYFQPTHVLLPPRFFFFGLSLWKWAKLEHIVSSMDINISNLPMWYFLQGFFFFFGLSLWKWAKLEHIVPSMDINISNLPVCYFQGFFCLSFSLESTSLHGTPPHPPFHPFKEPFNIHMQTFPTFKQKPFCNLTSLGESMMILWATHNCLLAVPPCYNPQIRMGSQPLGAWPGAWRV
jgi:hypothetical protein